MGSHDSSNDDLDPQIAAAPNLLRAAELGLGSSKSGYVARCLGQLTSAA